MVGFELWNYTAYALGGGLNPLLSPILGTRLKETVPNLDLDLRLAQCKEYIWHILSGSNMNFIQHPLRF